MNHIGRLLPLLMTLSCLSLSGCGGKEKIQIHGHMESLSYEGQTCWIFVDDEHKKYEVITNSGDVLKEGLQMTIKYEPVTRQTLCQLPTVIDIVEYRPDFAKDM